MQRDAGTDRSRRWLRPERDARVDRARSRSLLILGALSYAARGLIVGVDVVMVVGGVVLGAGGSTIMRDVGTVHGTGWAIMVAGIIAIVAGSLGRIIRTRHSIKTN